MQVIMPAMYDVSADRMTRAPLVDDYNPTMNAAEPGSPQWVPSLADVVLALALYVGVMVEASGADNSGFTAALPGLFLLAIPLAWRRRVPLLTFGIVIVGAISAVGAAQYLGLTCVMVAAYSLGAYGRYRLVSLGVLLATAFGIIIVFNGAAPQLPSWSSPFLILIPVWLVGNQLRLWRGRAEASAERALRVERDGEYATQVALIEERSRIARELHDVVAHHVSVMVVQAGAARQVLHSAPDDATQAMLAVESTGREAMTELRNFLGVLSDQEEPPSLVPQPGMRDMEALVQRVREAGLPVELRVAGAPRQLPSGVDLAAYRIVQEALTNALKYSGLAPTEVVLDFRARELKVEVLDEGTVAPAVSGAPGRGLAGMRERIALYGGSLEVGPRVDHGFAVRVWLPLTESPA